VCQPLLKKDKMKNIADQKFWTELSCWRKSYSNKQGYVAPMFKASLQKFYGRHHNLVDRYEISISQNCSSTFYVDVSFLYHCHDFYSTWLHTWVTRRASYKKPELLTLREHLSSPPVFCGVRVTHLFSFLCYPIMCLYVLNSVWFVFVQRAPGGSMS
jgi:hypothetical protein